LDQFIYALLYNMYKRFCCTEYTIKVGKKSDTKDFAFPGSSGG